MLYRGSTSVYLCTALLQNLTELQDFYPPLSVPLEWFTDPVFDGVGLAGFKSGANAFMFA